MVSEGWNDRLKANKGGCHRGGTLPILPRRLTMKISRGIVPLRRQSRSAARAAAKPTRSLPELGQQSDTCRVVGLESWSAVRLAPCLATRTKRNTSWHHSMFQFLFTHRSKTAQYSRSGVTVHFHSVVYRMYTLVTSHSQVALVTNVCGMYSHRPQQTSQISDRGFLVSP